MRKIVNKKIKNKIESKEEISNNDLYEYFHSFPIITEKNIFKKILQRYRVKSQDQTRQYLLDNFDVVLSSMSSQQLEDFFVCFSDSSHKKELFEKLSENNSYLAELFKDQDNYSLCGVFSNILKTEPEAHVFFEKNFKELYENTKGSLFDIKQFFTFNRRSPQLKSVILEQMSSLLSDRTIHKEDIATFLQESIYSAVSEDNVFFNEIRTPTTPISEKSKSKIQANINPDDALFMVQTTDEPLLVRKLLQSVDLNSPEITEYLDTHLDHIVQEIGKRITRFFDH